MAEELNINETETTEGKTYSQEEVDALLQKEADRRVSSALKKQAEKNEAKMREAQKLAQMDADQKYMYELEQREKAIAEKEKQLALAENRNICSKILSEKHISLDMVDFVVAEDADEMNERIKKLDKAFKASVKAEVEARIGSSAPKVSTPEEGLTKEKFAKLSLSQKQEMYNSDRELYNSMIGR